MSKYTITYTVNADSIDQASQIAYSHIYLADVDVDSVDVRAVKETGPSFRTFGDVPTETNPEVARRIFEPYFDEKSSSDLQN